MTQQSLDLVTLFLPLGLQPGGAGSQATLYVKSLFLFPFHLHYVSSCGPLGAILFPARIPADDGGSLTCWGFTRTIESGGGDGEWGGRGVGLTLRRLGQGWGLAPGTGFHPRQGS